MVESKSNTRFFTINNLVILAQTDTTVGFASQNYAKLTKIKSRSPLKPFIKIYTSLLLCEKRIPQNMKSFVRRSKKTTFIVKEQAFRVNTTMPNSQVQKRMHSYYSSSANEKGKTFERTFCESKADIIIENKDGLHESTSSVLLKINNNKKMRIR